MSHLDPKTATQLMLRTCDPPYIRIAPDLLDLDEEANPAANAIRDILGTDCTPDWPSAESHLAAWKDDRDESERMRLPDEEEEEYQDRLRRWEAWPEYKAKKQSEWLRCAVITRYALDYLQQCHKRGIRLSGKSEEGDYYGFQPKNFYEYIWICLNQGIGTRQWKTFPPMPPESEQDLGAWFAETARNCVVEVVKFWEHGMDLEALYPLITSDNLLPSPRDQEIILLVQAKHEEFLSLAKRVGKRQADDDDADAPARRRQRSN